ncbi:MAG: hypothetical protein H6551_10080 [Chitinophagales bacterium]|nr:hypothetical protein [Chitinophagales bacterium]
MAVKEVNERNKTIKVDPHSTVYLTITIGNAQIGGGIIKDENGKTIAKGEIKNELLGTGAQLNGKKYEVITNVLDVNKSTNGIVVTHYFHSEVPSTLTHTGRVDDDGDIYSLTTPYTFKV